MPAMPPRPGRMPTSRPTATPTSMYNRCVPLRTLTNAEPMTSSKGGDYFFSNFTSKRRLSHSFTHALASGSMLSATLTACWAAGPTACS